jgi:hypothetical protein
MNDFLRNERIPREVKAIALEIANRVYELIKFEKDVTQAQIEKELLHQLAAHYGKELKD